MKKVESHEISRRRFLSIFIPTVGNLFIPDVFKGTGSKEKIKIQRVDVPPSLMLHSKHAKLENLEPFLDAVLESGYRAVTYLEWIAAIANGQPIEKPILISCDDLTCVQNNNNIVVFRRIKDAFVQRGMAATFALITEPVLVDPDGNEVTATQQDPEKWEEIATWISQGMEIATHSSHHSNFNNADTTPRGDFDDEDYFHEVTRSALLIEEQLAEQGCIYKVRSFITPFGSGYSYQQQKPQIHPGIEKACKQAGLKLVVGISGGRTPIEVKRVFPTNKGVAYVGRIPPKEKEDGTGLDPYGTLGWINQWQATNENNDE